MTPERKIHQKKENKIPYLLFVSRIHELTKATQFIDLFGEDGGSEFNGTPPTPEPEIGNSSFLPTSEPTDRCWIGFAYMIPNFTEICGEGTT